ncbi:MAG: hypothetical protein JWQ61_3586 [Collimonas fungivorans]|uniref:DUF1810 domain-containing protein n=1 Tax=Collimonas fungivorans TaxID=158899 RepID=UPI0026EE5D77|nr:DUF1810 domain-containing protein [Collimonas fungivorans]MDB5768772.1 hypothetical protein [Collimonas fungivorans]
MSDQYNLQRFVAAQQPVFDIVREELSQGSKRSHWMWFVFPQIEGLGHSATAVKYAISSLEEARAYLEHPLLGPRLRECCRLVAVVDGRSAEDIFGFPDYMKFQSSLTLFAQAATDNQAFNECLKKYFGGEPDQATLVRL